MKKPAIIIGVGVALVVVAYLVSKKRQSTPLDIVRRAYQRALVGASSVVVEGGKLTGRFLDERRKRGGEIHIHKGIDIAAKLGRPIYAVNDGTVFLLWPNGEIRGYGNTVVVKNNDGTAALYAHLQSWVPELQVNQPVSKGQLIGYVGNTESGTLGKPMKPHLHLEIHARAQKLINKNVPPRLDPESYLESMGMTVG